MKLFQKLFKRQPGGSIFGNLLRGIGDKFTGGMVSQIIPKPGGGTQTVMVPAPAAPQMTLPPNILSAPQNYVAGTTSDMPIDKPGIMGWLKSKIYWIGGIVTVVAAWYFFLRGGKKPKRRY